MRDKYLVAVVCSSENILVGYPLIHIKCNLKPANMRGVKSFAMVLAVGVSLDPSGDFMS